MITAIVPLTHGSGHMLSPTEAGLTDLPLPKTLDQEMIGGLLIVDPAYTKTQILQQLIAKEACVLDPDGEIKDPRFYSCETLSDVKHYARARQITRSYLLTERGNFLAHIGHVNRILTLSCAALTSESGERILPDIHSLFSIGDVLFTRDPNRPAITEYHRKS